MKNVLVIYGSEYGSTKEYAEYIARACDAKCISTKQIKGISLDDYQTIVYGGGIYAGKLYDGNIIKQQEEQLRKKKMIVFGVGFSDPNNERDMVKVKQDVEDFFGKEWFQEMDFYLMRGNMLYSKMKWMHKMMLKMMVSVLKKKPETKEDVLVKTYGKDTYFSDLKQADVIISQIEEKGMVL